MKKRISQTKWKDAVEFIEIQREIPFSKLTQTNNKGNVVEFAESEKASDKGQFVKDLHSWLDFEILISNLPPKASKTRKALELKGQGYSNQEIANEIGVKLRTAEQLLHRGYKTIKKRFEIF